MFGLGTTELIIILVIVMLVFGSSRLPKLGKGLGEGLRSFKEAIKGDEERTAIDNSRNDSRDDEKHDGGAAKGA